MRQHLAALIVVYMVVCILADVSNMSAVPNCKYLDSGNDAEIYRECLEELLGKQFQNLSRLAEIPVKKSAVCVYTDGNNKPEVRHPVHFRPPDLATEINQFKRCICQTRFYGPCHFNMMETGYNTSVLNTFLGDITQAKTESIEFGLNRFKCSLKRDFLTLCFVDGMSSYTTQIPKTSHISSANLHCLFNALLPPSLDEKSTRPLRSTTAGRTRHTPSQHLTSTSYPVASQPSAAKLTIGLIIMGLGCAVCLLVGVLVTVCCVFCWRQRKKQRINDTLTMDRPMQVSRADICPSKATNNYIDVAANSEPNPGTEYHLYTEILGPSENESGVFLNPPRQSASYKREFSDTTNYDPLSHQDESTNWPDPCPKSQCPFDNNHSKHSYISCCPETELGGKRRYNFDDEQHQSHNALRLPGDVRKQNRSEISHTIRHHKENVSSADEMIQDYFVLEKPEETSLGYKI